MLLFTVFSIICFYSVEVFRSYAQGFELEDADILSPEGERGAGW